jgi:hypothetical protein
MFSEHYSIFGSGKPWHHCLKISFLHSRSKKSCFVLWQRKVSHDIIEFLLIKLFWFRSLFSGTYWLSAESRMASGEVQSSLSICSKNASLFSWGSGTDKLSLWGTDLIAELKFGFTRLYIFFAEKPVTMTEQTSCYQHDSLAAVIS